jgi:ribonuclease BN (tRNA processing enzyme)
MQVTLLGTGSALPSPDRVQAGVLLEAADTTLLVDCGSGVLHRLAQHGVGPLDVDAVLLTHHHLDHVADLPGLLKARVLQGESELSVQGPPGTERVLERLLSVDDLWARSELTTREVEPGRFESAGFEVEAFEGRHSKQCFAYRFGDDLAISGDTEPFDELATFFEGVDTLVHECSYPDGTDAPGHTTPSEVGEQLDGRGVDRMFLTHLFPRAEANADELRESVAERVGGTVRIGTDGTTFTTNG